MLSGHLETHRQSPNAGTTANRIGGKSMKTGRTVITALVITIAICVMAAGLSCTGETRETSQADPVSPTRAYTSAVIPILTSISSANKVYLMPMERAHQLDDSSTQGAFATVQEAAALYADDIAECREQWNEISPPDPLSKFHIDYAGYLQVEEESARLLASSVRLRDLHGVSMAMDIRDDNFEWLKECLERFEATTTIPDKGDDDLIL